MPQSELKTQLVKFLRDHSAEEFQSLELVGEIGGSISTINGYLVDLEIDSKVVRRSAGYIVYWKATEQEICIRRIMMTRLWTFDIFGVDTEED